MQGGLGWRIGCLSSLMTHNIGFLATSKLGYECKLGMYTVLKVSDHIGVIKLIPVSYWNDINDTFSDTIYGDIHKHRAIFTQMWMFFKLNPYYVFI